MFLYKSSRFIFILLLNFTVCLTSYSQCPTPAGDQTTPGASSWIGYVYANFISGANPPTDIFSAPYRGFVTQSENFIRDMGSGSITDGNVNLCGSYSDNFGIRYKMTKTYIAGDYEITVGGDDGYRLFINGVLQTALNNFSDHAYVTSTAFVSLSGTTELVLEYYDKGGNAAVSFNIRSVCATTTTAPTSISGINNICSGSSTTLTATGGSNGVSDGVASVYEWGSGSIVGNNVIVGETGVSITVSPTSTTTYWVRRVDKDRCKVTNGVTRQVIVGVTPSAPTSISGNSNCTGFPIVLTAVGGVGDTYEWGTGSIVGVSIIPGATNSTYIINSPVNGTTYWVRRTNLSPCPGSTTTGVTATLNLTPAPGNTAVYGNNSWIGYIYSQQSTFPPANGFSSNYSGFVTQPFTFDQNLGFGALAGPNLCNSYSESFAGRYRMTQTMAAGSYTITVGADDGFRLSVDGGNTWITNSSFWSDHGYTTETVSVALSGTVNFVLEYYERGGESRLSFYMCSTAPTGISGTNAICTGTSTTLTATGGVEASNVTYQWGTGSIVGSNIIAGTTASITVSPTSNTTYWVRRNSAGGCAITSGVTQLVSVSPTTIAGTTSGSQKVCVNTAPIGDVILTGNNGTVVRWERSSDINFISPAPTVIANNSTTLSGISIGIITVPTYVRAVVRSGACTEINSTSVLIDFDSTTWNGTAWSNGLPSMTKTVIINGSYNTTANGNIDACTVIINSGVTLTIPSATYLLIQNNLTVNGTINIQNSGSLVQLSPTSVNTGNINMLRTTSPYERFDYVYWSSPVASTTMANPFNGWRMDRAYEFVTSNFSDLFSGPYPQTLPGRDSFDDNGDDYQNVTNATVMTPGKGYIVMTPTTGTFPTTANVTFTGVPSNGIISVPLALSADNTDNNDDFNLVGNPYPSAISATTFINANLPNISGTLYFWTHVGNISPSNPGPNSNNYNSNDYALYNLSGGTRAALTPGASTVPNGFIGAGQGFFVDAQNTNSLIFNNSMRSTAHSNTQFFRSSTNNITTQSADNAQDRMWLNIYNGDQMFSQQLINYNPNASSGFDLGYDGVVSPTQNFLSFYSTSQSDTNLYRIQAKGAWNENDTISLGYFSAVAGTTSIAIDAREGIFNTSSTNIFLQDNLLNITHNLKLSPYTFTTGIGTFNTRFVLKYTNTTLGLNDNVVNSNDVNIFSRNQNVEINSLSEAISSVQIFDIVGRKVAEKTNVNANEYMFSNLNAAQQTLIVKVILNNGQIVTKKLIY